MLENQKILLIVGGGIAAYKSLELIRLLGREGASVQPVLTSAGKEFVTALSLASLSGNQVYEDLFSLTDETEMGHIQLSRQADLLVVAPATADLMAKMATGLAGDLATTLLLATDKPVLIAPAMNVRMWEHPATQRNLATLAADGIHIVGPTEGDMACGEFGMGRMSEPADILAAISAIKSGVTQSKTGKPLEGVRAVVTSGPTQEPLDPVRYIGNRSSGKQGHAIAAALVAAGAETVLITGPSAEPDPIGATIIHVDTTAEMLAASETAMPADVFVGAAAVADWRVRDVAASKIKKGEADEMEISFIKNPDIVATIGNRKKARPALVIGFAAETDNVIEYAKKKRIQKGCDWILANDVSADAAGRSKVFGKTENKVHLINGSSVEDWPNLAKSEVAARLVDHIAAHLGGR